MRYFDSSALVKRYVREAGSLQVRRLMAKGAFATSRISAVEIASVLMRRSREGAFSGVECQRALAALEADLAAVLVVELTPAVVSLARALLQSHPLRAGDAIQLASGLHLQEQLGEDVPFVVFDARLSAAARSEGLRVEPAPVRRRTTKAL